MAEIMTPQQADIALSRGLITLEQYGKIVAPQAQQEMPSTNIDFTGQAPVEISPVASASVQAPIPAPTPTPPPAPQAQMPATPDVGVAAGAPSPQQQQQQGMVAPQTGFDLQTLAIAQQGAAIKSKEAGDIAAYSLAEKKAAELEKSKAESLMKMEQASNKALEDYNQSVQELSAIKLDPNQYWANKTTPQKIAIGIGLFLGAFGRGNEYQAMNILNRAIDDDIALQKSNIMAKRGEVQERENVFQKMINKFRDERSATAAAKAALYDQAQIELQKTAAKYQGGMGSAQVTQALGQLQSAKEAELAKLAQAKMLGLDPMIENLTEDQRERYVPGYTLALDKNAAQKAREVVAAKNSAVNVIDDMIKLPEKTLSLEARNKAEILKTQLTGFLRIPFTGPGVLTESERAMLMDILGDPTKILTMSNQKQKLMDLKKTLINTTNRQVEAYGAKPMTDVMNKRFGAEAR